MDIQLRKRGWMTQAQQLGATHVIHLQNINDYEHFPIFVPPGNDAKKMFEEQVGGSNSAYKLRGVYRLSDDWDEQMDGWNIFNW